VFLIGGSAQLIGGWLADRMALKPLYVLSFALKLPLLLLAGAVGGWPAVAVAALIAVMLDIGGPAENLLLARYAGGRRQGLAFGLRYAIAFAAAPLGIGLVALLYAPERGGFLPMFLVLTGLTVVMLAAAWRLPSAPRAAAAAPLPVPAE
jgi:MFS transporter, FSR family, fosmidomycin resistance protein